MAWSVISFFLRAIGCEWMCGLFYDLSFVLSLLSFSALLHSHTSSASCIWWCVWPHLLTCTLFTHVFIDCSLFGYAFVSRGVFVCVCECSAVFQQLKITSRIWSEFLFSATVAAAKLERVWTWTNRFAIGNTMKRRRERNKKMRALTHKSHVRS